MNLQKTDFQGFPCVIFITDSKLQSLYAAHSPNPSKEQIMKTNEGTIDRVVRVIAGLALIAMAATGTIGVWGYIGVVLLLTGIIGICPGYAIFGISSCPMKKK